MSVKNLYPTALSRLHPALPRERPVDKAFVFSLGMSLLVHATVGAFLLGLFAAPRAHVFLLVESGEEAMEMAVGGAFESAASRPNPLTEVAEKRFLPDPALPPPEKRETVEEPLPASPVEPLERHPALEQTPPESPARPLERKTPNHEREAGAPEIRNLPFPDLAAVPEGRERRSDAETKEMRFEEFIPDRLEVEEATGRRVEEELAEAAPLAAGPAPSEKVVAESPAERLTRTTRRRYHEPKDQPETSAPQTLAPPAPASAASAIGSDRSVRGVRQRVRAASSLVPRYPDGSRRRGEQGAVVVRAMIDASGRCRWARVESSSGYSALDNSAVDTVRRASFQPARVDGAATAMEERFRIVFQLR